MADGKKPKQAKPNISAPAPQLPRLAKAFMRDRWHRMVEGEAEARRVRVWGPTCRLTPRYAAALALIHGAIMDKSVQLISLEKFSGIMRERAAHAAALLRDLDAEDLVEVRQIDADTFEVRPPLERETPPTEQELARLKSEAVAAQDERASRWRKGRGQ
jgi:hypothetical protein